MFYPPSTAVFQTEPFILGFPNNFYFSRLPIRATCPARLVLVTLIALITFREAYKL